jgi:hypothetical protein
MFVRETQVLYEGVSFLKIIRISDLSSYYLRFSVGPLSCVVVVVYLFPAQKFGPVI